MRSNSTPFSDVCDLIETTAVTDEDGYETQLEKATRVFCSVNRGAVRTEFYEAMKSGVELTVTAELWESEYGGERLLDFEGSRYKVVRAYPTGHGTLELSCSEVVR